LDSMCSRAVYQQCLTEAYGLLRTDTQDPINLHDNEFASSLIALSTNEHYSLVSALRGALAPRPHPGRRPQGVD